MKGWGGAFEEGRGLSLPLQKLLSGESSLKPVRKQDGGLHPGFTVSPAA